MFRKKPWTPSARGCLYRPAATHCSLCLPFSLSLSGWVGGGSVGGDSRHPTEVTTAAHTYLITFGASSLLYFHW